MRERFKIHPRVCTCQNGMSRNLPIKTGNSPHRSIALTISAQNSSGRRYSTSEGVAISGMGGSLPRRSETRTCNSLDENRPSRENLGSIRCTGGNPGSRVFDCQPARRRGPVPDRQLFAAAGRAIAERRRRFNQHRLHRARRPPQLPGGLQAYQMASADVSTHRALPVRTISRPW